MAEAKKQRTFKVIILGDTSVGKTALLEQYVNKVFMGSYQVTIGCDFLSKQLEVDGTLVTLQIWDTAGQERYQSLTRPHFRGVDACVYVFDVTSKPSFAGLSKWVSTFTESLPPWKQADFPAVVFGNKIDKSGRTVDPDAARSFCKSNNLLYFETSAKSREGLDTAFLELIRQALRQAQKQA